MNKKLTIASLLIVVCSSIIGANLERARIEHEKTADKSIRSFIRGKELASVEQLSDQGRHENWALSNVWHDFGRCMAAMDGENAVTYNPRKTTLWMYPVAFDMNALRNPDVKSESDKLAVCSAFFKKYYETGCSELTSATFDVEGERQQLPRVLAELQHYSDNRPLSKLS